MTLELIAQLSDKEKRYQNSSRVAGHIGGSYLIFFIIDPLINSLLPAPGYPQTLPNGTTWQAFLKDASTREFFSGILPYPDMNHQLNATAVKGSKGAIAVILGGSPDREKLIVLKKSMPLLVALFEQEQAAIAARSTAVIAEKSVERAEKLTYAIDIIRLQLNDALVAQEKDKKAIEELLEKKDEFMNIASHELKTPIASMKAYLQVLARHFPNGSHAATGFIEKANKQADKLSALVNDLLDVNKIQAGHMEFSITEFNLLDIVYEAVAQFENITDEHHFIIKGETTANVFGDKNRIEQVLSNLLANAIKYSPDGYKIIVNIAKKNNHIKVEVTDFGIGIPKEDIPYLFDRFFRVKNVVPRFSGLGLGLYISSQIIRRHGGEIGVCTEPVKGSTFWFTIPQSNKQ